MSDCRIRYLSVPHGSTLLLATEADGPYQSSGPVACDGESIHQLTKADLDPGPAEFELESPHIYVAVINVQFTGRNTTTITVRAAIVKPDGSRHSSSKDCEFSSADGRSHASRILVVTEASQ